MFRRGLSASSQQRFIFRFASILLTAFVAVIAASGIHLPVKTYTVADGLLRDSVYKIKQDAKGFLWLCTPEGLSRFDGYGFTNFTTDDGLPDRHINDLLQMSDGTIYVASDGGLARLEPIGSDRTAGKPLFTVFRPDQKVSTRFQVLLETAGGKLMCGTNEGVFIFDGSAFEPAEFAQAVGDVDVLDLRRVSDGNVWAATASNGIFFSSDDIHFVTGPTLPEVNLPTMFESHDRKLWVGMRPGAKGGLCRLDVATRAVERCYSPNDGLPSGWVTNIVETRDNTLWIGTAKSLCQWKGEGAGGVCKDLSAKNDICDDDVWGMSEDKDDNLWVGTRCGVKKIARSGFSYFNENDGLGRGLTNSIFEDGSGRLLTSIILPTGRQIAELDGDSFRSLVPELNGHVTYFGWGWKQTVLHDSSGAWWVPTGSGVYKSPPGTSFDGLKTIRLQRTEFPPNDREVFRVFEDSRANVWIATTGSSVGLWRWNRRDNSWSDFSHEAGIGPTRQVTAFVEDPEHNLWIATGSDSDDTGLIRINAETTRVYSRSYNTLIQGWLRDIYFDDRGRLWMASTATGLLRLDDPNGEHPAIKQYSRAEGMSSNGVYCVTQDEFGYIYAGTGRGIDRLDTDNGTVENFTTFDGLPDSTVEVCYRDRNGELWFGTSHGLARYSPQPQRQRRPPSLLITGLRVNGAPQHISVLGETSVSDLDLSSSQRSLSVDFVGLGATLGEKLRYEYSLNGSAWTPTSDRTLNFADLRSGGYTLALRAVTREGIATDSPATLGFTIATPLWQRWWFVLWAAIGFAALVYFFYRGRINKLLELERTRTRIATDLHDDIGSNLSKIALLSELVKMKLTNGNEENNRMLATIADVSRQTVDSMRDIVWSINPLRDSVLELTRRMREHAEEALVPLGVTVHFETEERHREQSISMDVRRELFLIFKEAVNNAAKYSGCENVWIAFLAEGRSISMSIRDDGRGFDVSAPPRSNGLWNMRQRAEKVGGAFEIVSQLGLGTTASVKISPSQVSRLTT